MSTYRAHPLYRLASAPLCEASSELLAELALVVWYADSAVPGLQSVLDCMVVGPELMLRRAIYLIDRLRRFPCITNEKASQLKRVVDNFSALKATEYSGNIPSHSCFRGSEVLACAWGINEDVNRQMKFILHYQTRSYAASLGIKTGYTE